MSKKMNQVLAVEKNVKAKAYQSFTDLHKAAQQAALLNGHTKTYQPKEETDQTIPPQTLKVQMNAADMFQEARKLLTEYFDVTATKDWGNQLAKADVEVDGQVLLKDVPATYLLFLDKQLNDLRTFVSKFTELDPSIEWTKDPSTGLFKSDAIATVRTEKKQRPLVLYQATPQHPAQTQLVTEDVTVGTWYTTKFSGAIPATQKRELLDRIDRMTQAVKQALEHANMTAVETKKTGDVVLGYIFG